MTDIVEWLLWNAKEQGSRFAEAAGEIERLRKYENIAKVIVNSEKPTTPSQLLDQYSDWFNICDMAINGIKPDELEKTRPRSGKLYFFPEKKDIWPVTEEGL